MNQQTSQSSGSDMLLRRNITYLWFKLSVMIWLFLLLLQGSLFHVTMGSWDEWWTYDGISGPDFWGLLNPEWSICNKGRRQSPIDIKPNLLLFDPLLRQLHVDKNRVNGILENNGHSIVFRIEEVQQQQSSSDTESSSPENEAATSPTRNPSHITITGGPLSYTYVFDSIYLHFGRADSLGSEHFMDGISFPAEIQIMGYNSDLYHNISEASRKANGIIGISLLIKLSNSSNVELRLLTNHIHNIRFRGQNVHIKSLSIRDLIPDLDSYMTYEGSYSIPGCWETVIWIIINKPVLITRQQLYGLRKLMQGEDGSPKAPLGNNIRPPQQLNNRVVRTNIDFKRIKTKNCPNMGRNMYYQVNRQHLRN